MDFSFMRRLLIAGAVSAFATASHAAVIDGVTTTSSVGTFGTYDIEALTNGEGLSTPGSTDATHDTNFSDMWLSGNNNTSGSLLFNLGDVFSLDTIDIWNYNAICCGLDRGVMEFDLEVSTDGVTFSSLLGTSMLAQSIGLETLDSEQFSLGGMIGQYVRLNIFNNYGDTTYVGLSEVMFSGEALAAVPIPATLPLLVLGLGGLGFAARRRRKSA